MSAIAMLLVIAGAAWADQAEFEMTNDKVAPLSRFLEAEPLNRTARTARALVLKWEEGSKDVVDVVCPSLFPELLKQSTPFNSELLAQFVIGSAAYQIENPEEKGKLLPQQIAGVRSMVKTYRSLKAQKPKLRIAQLEEFALHEADGTLTEFLAPLVSSACSGGAK